MKTVKVLTSAQRADWLIRDPDGYFAFVKAEAAAIARRTLRKPRPAKQ